MWKAIVNSALSDACNSNVRKPDDCSTINVPSISLSNVPGVSE